MNQIYNPLPEHIIKIQSDIQDLNSHIASSGKMAFKDKNVHVLEEWIDEFDSKVPKLSKFILPVHKRYMERNVLIDDDIM